MKARRWHAGAFLWLLLALLARPVHADITVSASLNATRATVGEPLALVIEAKGAQDIPAPALSIDGFDVRYVGPSTQISFVNGQMSASVQHRYSLQPTRPGHFTVGPFTIEYQGKQYQTAALAVGVAAAGQPAAPAPGAAPGAAAAPGQAAQGRTLFLTLSASQPEVYLHERLTLDVTLYVGAVRAGDVQYPTLTAEGLSVDKFGEPTQRQEVIDGQTFQLVHFQASAFPVRAGKLTLGPAVLRLNVYDNRRRNNAFNDPFFDNFFQQARPVDLRSEPLTLNVLPLPEDGRPPGFSGAVGTFTLDVAAAPTQLTAGDPITLRMNVTGSGNLGDATAPLLTHTDGFRTYAAQAAKSDAAGKSFEQVLIPNDPNVRAVPPVRFSFFDPQARRYQVLQSQPIALVVRPAQPAARAEGVAGTGRAAAKAGEEELGRDIVYIKDDPGRLAARTGRRLPTFVLLWPPIPVLLFAAAVWYDRRRQLLRGDLRFARFTRAGKEARRGLAAAQQALARANREEFYNAVSRTMQEYLAAKLDLPPGAIDDGAVSQCGLPAECVEQVRRFFTTCEQIRFAPASGDGDMRGTLALAQEIIKRLERGRRFSPTNGRIAALLVLSVTCVSAAAAYATEAPVSPQTTFFHANALYKDGQYDAAAQEYAQLVHAGLESGNLYFNLGNAYFKAGEKGKAILNYERALRLQPGDPDVQANLAYAQSLSGAEPCSVPLWQRLSFPLAHRMSTRRLTWVTGVIYTLLFAVLALYRLWPQRPRWLAYIAGTTAALLAVTLGSLTHQAFADTWQRQAVVVGDGETAARFEPADNGTVHFALKEGSLVRVLDGREGWLQIARCDGRRGWVRKDTIEELQIAN